MIDDKKQILQAIKKDGLALRRASEGLKNDKEVVLAAFKKSKFSFNFSSRKLRSDCRFVLQLMMIEHQKGLKISDTDLFRRCHSSLRKCEDIYLPALKKQPTLCKHFSLQVLLKLDFSSLPKKNKEVIYQDYVKRSKEKDIFLLAKAKRHILSDLCSKMVS